MAGIAESAGARAEVQIDEGVPITYNDRILGVLRLSLPCGYVEDQGVLRFLIAVITTGVHPAERMENP